VKESKGETMKLNKRTIYEYTVNRPPIVQVPDDGWSEISLHHDSKEVAMGTEYRASKFELTLSRLVTHRLQEMNAVRENVSHSFFMEIYGDILAQLHKLAHTARYAQRDEIINDISRLIDWIEGREQ
jgi:hypothetical protein